MKITDITTIENRVRKNFNYKADPRDYDNWRSRADEVGHLWEGDCDDLTCTVLDLMVQSGVKLEDLYRLIVWAPGKVGHMVGLIFDDAGTPWIVGDTYSKFPYPAVKMSHVPNRYQEMSEVVPGDTWHQGVPWST